MDINAAFPSDYLKAADLLGKEITASMTDVRMTDIGDDHKPVLHFAGTERGLVLNKTNSNTIADAYGADTEQWFGKKVVLFPTKTDFQGRQVDCIRVRVDQPQSEPDGQEAPF